MSLVLSNNLHMCHACSSCYLSTGCVSIVKGPDLHRHHLERQPFCSTSVTSVGLRAFFESQKHAERQPTALAGHIIQQELPVATPRRHTGVTSAAADPPFVYRLCRPDSQKVRGLRTPVARCVPDGELVAQLYYRATTFMETIIHDRTPLADYLKGRFLPVSSRRPFSSAGHASDLPFWCHARPGRRTTATTAAVADASGFRKPR